MTRAKLEQLQALLLEWRDEQCDQCRQGIIARLVGHYQYAHLEKDGGNGFGCHAFRAHGRLESCWLDLLPDDCPDEE